MSYSYSYDPKTARFGFGTSTLRDQETLIKYLREVNNHPYDFVDCAWRYGNEAIIGLSLKSLRREDPNFELKLNFQSKVWPTQFFGGITKSLKFTLQKIGVLSAIDAYMLHRPAHDMSLNLSAWKQLIECKRNRLTKNIGLGHFDKDLIEKLYEATGIRPQFLQIELSVNNMRYDRIHYCRQHNIEIQAYEPLGDYEENLKNPLLIRLSEKYNTSIKHILLAFLLNQGIVPVVIPENVEEIGELLKAKEILLDPEDIELMRSLNTYKNKHFESLELDFKEEK
ncbi:aldo/keto reductase [Candidatus Mycoplasma haematohominis]|uniref:aldo/keto reductase n=1 Tax=Candidatus Mycoplasma haematohominis TaxID=1494318 RepID=UPI001C0A6CC0|nr:aldo/keto reductase [Candidatus Mycoplasma haemohominis]